MNKKFQGKIDLWIGIEILFAFFFGILAIVGFWLFTGNITVEYGENTFTIVASYWPDKEIAYDDITNIEYADQKVKGSRVSGFASFRLLMGNFKNSTYGNYTRYTYADCDAGVVLTVDARKVVLSGKGPESTREIYEELLERCGKEEFSISTNYDEDMQIYEISCEGTATKLYIKGEALNAEAEWKLQDVNSGVYHTKTEDGIYDTYGDVSCLIATYTMDGLGNLQIYFNYDAEGKVNILDLQMNAKKILKTNPDHLIAEIPEKNLWIYYDEWRDGRYHGIFIQKQVGEQTAGYSYDWEFDAYAADYNYFPEISLLHNKEHLLLHFTQGTGTGLFQTEAHILDLNTMKEITIQSPEEFLAEAIVPLDKNVETGELSFTHQGQFVSEVIPSDILAQENYTIGYGGWFQYGVEEDTLVYTTALQFGPIHYFGDLTLNYAWKDGQYQVESTAYQSMGAY